MKLFRASMKRLPKMETILEEVYVTIKEPGPVLEIEWKGMWIAAREIETHWGQWTDIEYEYIDVCYEPVMPPPAIR
jgi:hypothetical protein